MQKFSVVFTCFPLLLTCRISVYLRVMGIAAVRFIAFDRIHYYHGTTAPSAPGPHYCRRFTITLRHTTLSWTPLDE